MCPLQPRVRLRSEIISRLATPDRFDIETVFLNLKLSILSVDRMIEAVGIQDLLRPNKINKDDGCQ